MLNTQSLEWLMACERLKDEVTAVEKQCESILGRFEHLQREPTAAERDARRQAYLDNRARLRALNSSIEAINARLRARASKAIAIESVTALRGVPRNAALFIWVEIADRNYAIGAAKRRQISPITLPNKNAVHR